MLVSVESPIPLQAIGWQKRFCPLCIYACTAHSNPSTCLSKCCLQSWDNLAVCFDRLARSGAACRSNAGVVMNKVPSAKAPVIKYHDRTILGKAAEQVWAPNARGRSSPCNQDKRPACPAAACFTVLFSTTCKAAGHGCSPGSDVFCRGPKVK